VEGKLTLVTRNGKEVLGPGRVANSAPFGADDCHLATPARQGISGTRPVKLWALNLKRCE
jgi:hypothetical protein